MTRDQLEQIHNMRYSGLGNGCGPTLMYGLLIAWIVMSLAGCKTTSMMERTEIRDSIRIKDSIRIIDQIRDSVNIINQRQVRDSIRIKDSIVVVVDSAGNEKQRKEFHTEQQFHSEKDSTSYYKALWNETMQELIRERDATYERDHQKETTIEKKPSLWQRIQSQASGFMAGVVIVLTALFILYIKKRLKNRIA